ncbi:hypothetical protein [Spiroplasma endosymbiont of Cantharis lateralis]|uniref:hypothetical protein n=1 Tax=Spiroplasma endosymbiont of Cantharis lateralis TaxID=3066277 RepID=UPI00313B95C5
MKIILTKMNENEISIKIDKNQSEQIFNKENIDYELYNWLVDNIDYLDRKISFDYDENNLFLNLIVGLIQSFINLKN